MDKSLISCFSFTIITLISAGAPHDFCESCMPVGQCSILSSLGLEEYRSLVKKYRCNHLDGRGIAPVAAYISGRDYICCPNQLWGVKNKESTQRPNSDSSSRLTEGNQFRYPYDDPGNFGNQNGYPNSGYYNTYRQTNNDGSANNNYQPDNYNYGSDNYNYGSANNSYDDGYKGGNERYNFQNNKRWESRNDRNQNTDRNRSYIIPTRWSTTTKKYWNDRPDKSKWDIGNQIYFLGNNNNRRGSRFNNMNFGNNNQGGGKNNYGNNQRTGGNNFENNNYSSNFPRNGQAGKSGQCDSVTRFPPNPEGGCCGLEASDDDRITGTPFKLNDNNQLQTKLTKTIDGGKETDLTQYPWTALVLATFDNGLQRTSFNCGGALISSRFVLTASHCLYDDETRLKSVQVYLAEYDKRTFPLDCKMTGDGRKCVKNLALYAEDVIIHPRFLESRLLNDIALIRLQQDAPYTDYIRPICLPSINIDDPEHARLPLTVAGWGRDGEYKTDVKQFTTVQLVPQNGCRRFYPDLTPRHLCAAGYTGQDTCKGDSGGPLMTKYRGKYYIEGVVSGKRNDAPCGSAVPSLYTNVYHYLDWIRSNIGN